MPPPLTRHEQAPAGENVPTEHQPLGGVNHCRRIVYNATSAFRHQANGRKVFEPTATEQF